MSRQTGRAIDPVKFRQLITEKCWSLYEFSVKARVAERTVRYAANGALAANGGPRAYRPEIVQRMANALGVDPGQFSTPIGPVLTATKQVA